MAEDQLLGVLYSLHIYYQQTCLQLARKIGCTQEDTYLSKIRLRQQITNTLSYYVKKVTFHLSSSSWMNKYATYTFEVFRKRRPI